jgi:hypothetical protein
VKDTPKAPAKDPPEPSALEKMREFTRRIVAVPKEEIQRKDEKKGKAHRHLPA